VQSQEIRLAQNVKQVTTARELIDLSPNASLGTSVLTYRLKGLLSSPVQLALITQVTVLLIGLKTVWCAPQDRTAQKAQPPPCLACQATCVRSQE